MDSVKVAIRVRPLISREQGGEILWTADTHRIKLKEGKSKPYIFDRVFDHEETTSDVYEEIVEPIVQSAMDGFNGTVFAYGQTSSGKTYTMMGDKHNPGIIPLTVDETFNLIQKTPEREFLFRVSYMEIYNEVVRDLLSSSSEGPGLQIREDEFRNAVVQGLTEKLVLSPNDVMKLMEIGEKKRHTGCTNMNERSSRSHTIFRMIIESRERAEPNNTRDSLETDSAIKVSQLNLVDLAGSERASQTGAEGQRLKEGCHINKSLSTLGLVINQICKASESGQSAQFISYRDSKLTRILQPSLGGNALTAIICAVTPASLEDTDGTLRFASSAKKIKNKPHVNEVLSDEALLFRQKREINQLKKKIQEMEHKAGMKQTAELEELRQEKIKLQKEQEDKMQMLKKILLVSTQPADSKRQRAVRRETWCPGALAAPSRSPPWKNSNLDSTLMLNQSNIFQKIDQTLNLADDGPFIREKKIRFLDDSVAGTSKKLKTTAEDSAEEASGKFTFLEEELLSMRKKQEELEDELMNTKAQKNKHLQEIDTLRMRMSKMEGQFTMTQETLEIAVKEKDELETEKEKLDETIKVMNLKLSDYMKRERQWENSNPDITALRNENQDLRDQLSETCHQNRQLQEKADNERDTNEYLQSVMEEVSKDATETKKNLSSQLDEYKHQVSVLQTQLESTFANNSHSPTALVDAHKLEQEVKDLKQELDKNKEELEKQMVENQELITKLEEANSKIQNSSVFQPGENSEEDKSLKSDLNQEEIENLRSELCKLQEEILCKDAELQELKISAEQKKEVDAGSEPDRIGERTFNEALTSCETLINERDEVKSECKKLHEEMEKLHSQVEGMKNKIADLEEHDEFVKMEKEMLLEQEKESMQEIERLQKELSLREEEIEKLKDSTGKDTCSSEKVTGDTDEIRNLQEEIFNLLKSSADAQEMLQEANKNLALANDEKEAQMKKNEELEKELKRLRSDVESFDTMAEMTKAKYELREKELTQQLQSAYDELGGEIPLARANQPAVEQLHEYEVAVSEKEQQIKDLSAQLEASSSKLVDLQKQILEYQEKISELESKQVQENQPREDVAESDLDAFKSWKDLSLDDLREKLEEVENLYQEKDEFAKQCEQNAGKIFELENLLREKEEDLRELEEAKESISNLEKVIQDKDSKIKEMEETSSNSEDSKVPEELQVRLDVVVKLEEEIQEKNVEMSNIKSKLEEVESLISQKDDNLAALEEKLEEAQQKQVKLDAVVKLEEEIQEKNVEMGKIKSKLDEVESLISQKDDSLAALEEKLKDAQRKQEELMEQQNEISDESDEMSTERKLREELAQARKDLAEMSERYSKLHTVTEHAQGALLAETNRELDQQRLLDNAERERRESLAVFANERESANKQINELLHKVNELQTALCKSNVDKDIATRQSSKTMEECEFLRQQVKDLENIHHNEPSVIPRNAAMDPDKMVVKIKQLSLNLELTKQTSDKLNVTNKKLQDENRRLESEMVRVINLQGEVTRLQAILDQERKLREEENLRGKMREKETEEMRNKIREHQQEMHKMESSFDLKTFEVTENLNSVTAKKNQLQNELNETKQAISTLETKIRELKDKDKEVAANRQEEQDQLEMLRREIEEEKVSKKNLEQKMESLQEGFDHSLKSLEQAKEKYAELEERNTSLLNELERIQEDSEMKKMQVEEEMNKRNLLEQNLEHLREELEKIKKDSEEVATEAIKSKESEISNLLQMKEEITAKNAGLEEDLQESMEKIENLQNILSEMESEKVKLNQRIADLTENQQIFTSKEEDYKMLQDEYNTLVKEKDSILAQYKESEENLNSEMEELRNSEKNLRERINELEELKEEAVSLQDEVGETVEELRSNRNSLKEKINLQTDELEQVRSALEEYKTTQIDLKSQVENLQQKISDLEQELETVRKEKSTLEEESASAMEALERDFEVLTQENLELKSSVEELKLGTSAYDDSIGLNKVIQELSESVKEKDNQIEQLLLKNSEDNSISANDSSLEVENLKIQLLEKQKDFENYEKEVHILKERCKQLEEDLARQQKETEDDGLGFAASLDQELIENLSDQVADLKIQLEEKEEEIAELKKEMKSIASRNESHLPQNESKTSEEVEALQAKLDQLSSDLNTKDEEISQLSLLKKEAEEKLEHLQSLRSAEEEAVTEMKKQLLDLQQNLEREDSRVLSMKLAKEEAEEALEKLKLENCDPAQDSECINILKGNLEEKENEIKLLTEDLEGQNGKVEELLSEKKQLEEQFECLQKSLQKDLEGQNEKVEELLSEKKQLEEQCECLQNSLTSAQNTIEEVKSKLEETSLNNAKLHEEMGKLQQEKDHLQCVKSEIESELEGLKSLMKEKEETKDTQFDEHAQLDAEVENYKKKAINLETELNGVYAMIREKAAEMEEFASSRETLERNCELLTQENLDLKSSLERLKSNEIENLEDDLLQSKEQIKELDLEIQKMTEKQDSTELELEELKKENQGLEKRIKDFEQENLHLKASIENLQTLQEDLHSAKENISSLELEIATVTEQRDSTNLEADKLRQDNLDLESKLEELKDSQQMDVQLENENHQILQKELDIIKTKLESSTVEKQVLEGEVEKLKSQVDKISQKHDEEVKSMITRHKEESSTQIKALTDKQEAEKKQAAAEIEEMKGLLYKKELEVQSMEMDINNWAERYEKLKNELEEAVVSAKEEISKQNEENSTKIFELEEKLHEALGFEKELESTKLICSDVEKKYQDEKARAEDILSKLEGEKERCSQLNTELKQVLEQENRRKTRSAQQESTAASELTKEQEKCRKLEKRITELEKELAEKMLQAKENLRTTQNKLNARIDSLEESLFEADKEFEEEKRKSEELRRKWEESEKKLERAVPAHTISSYSEMNKRIKSEENLQRMNDELTAEKEKCRKLEGRITELEKELKEKLEEADERIKTSQKKLNVRIDSLEENLFEADKELEEEKGKNKELKRKLEESERKHERAGATHTRASSNACQNGELDRLKETCSKTETRYKEEKQKVQTLAKHLKIEKERCSKLVARLEDAAVRRTPNHPPIDTSEAASELRFEKERNKKLSEKLAKLEKEFSEKMEAAEAQFKITRKDLMSRVQSLEDNCIETDKELEEEKEKSKELETKYKITEKQLKQLRESFGKCSTKGKGQEDALRKQLLEKEDVISDLQMKMISCTQPFEKEVKQLKDELEVSEGKVFKLKQQLRLNQKESDDDTVCRVTRSSTSTASSSASYRGGSGGLVVSDTKVYVLEMEICSLQKRIKHLEKELGKYKDIETKRRSENMELLEENKKYREIIQSAREKRKISHEKVLAENPRILNEGSKGASSSFTSKHQEEIPPSQDNQDDKCKSQ